MMDYMDKGGMLMWPILLCSVLGLAIFLERVIHLAVMSRRNRQVASQVIAALDQERDAEAMALARESRSPMGHMLVQAMEVMAQDRETLETVIVHAAEEEVRGLSRYLQALASIGNIAPLLGLLGTVTGMIKAFMVVQETGGKVNAATLAGGIWEALLTTAAGLFVAIPIMGAHSYLHSRVEHMEAWLQDGGVRFLKSLSRRRKG